MSEIKRITSVKVDDLTRSVLNYNFRELWEKQQWPGSGSSYLQIGADGTLTLIGDATVWEDLRFPATSLNPPGTESDADVEKTGVFVGTLLFAAGSTEICCGVAQFPHSMKIGSSIYPHVHWSPTTAGAGDVLWRLEYIHANINGVFAGTYEELTALDTASGVANTHQIISFDPIVGTTIGLSSIMCWKLSRIGGDSTDTYGADARLLEFDIHYEIDTMGSREEYVK
jgi:hypothetical protein